MAGLGHGAVRKGLLVSCGVSPVALGSLHPNLKEMIITDIAQGDPFYHLDALHSAKAKEGKDSSSSQPLPSVSEGTPCAVVLQLDRVRYSRRLLRPPKGEQIEYCPEDDVRRRRSLR